MMKTVIKREDVAGVSQQFLPGASDYLAAAWPALPSHTMTRIGEVIAREVRLFKRGGDDLAEVILTPDIQTQLTLRLQWHDGQVTAQAGCERGDYPSLTAFWPQLQTQLAQYGVRLAPLTRPTPTGVTEFFSRADFSTASSTEVYVAHQHPHRRQPAAPPLFAVQRQPQSERHAAKVRP